jgi:hypothetical protein
MNRITSIRGRDAKSLAKHQLPDILKSIEVMASAAADAVPASVIHPDDPSTSEMVAQWLSSSTPRPTQLPVKSPLAEGIEMMLEKPADFRDI